MKRREFLTVFGGIAAWPLAANAQQPRPVIGFLHQGALPPQSLTAAFRKGLVEAGVSDGLSIAIEDRPADGQYDRLPALAADLVGHQVTVIAADFLPAALAAKAATQTIPVIFLIGSDPIGSGLVSSVNRPTGNVTGVAFMFTRLGAKKPGAVTCTRTRRHFDRGAHQSDQSQLGASVARFAGRGERSGTNDCSGEGQYGSGNRRRFSHVAPTPDASLACHC